MGRENAWAMYGDYYSGIYTIWCQRTGRVYVGQTLDVRERGRDHKSALQSEIRAHHNSTLQEDWQLIEAEDFPYVVRERYVPFDPKTLRAREQVWCKVSVQLPGLRTWWRVCRGGVVLPRSVER
jgi:hypothetical protein